MCLWEALNSVNYTVDNLSERPMINSGSKFTDEYLQPSFTPRLYMGDKQGEFGIASHNGHIRKWQVGVFELEVRPDRT